MYMHVYNDKCSIIQAVSLEANIFIFTSGEYNYTNRGYSCAPRNLARLVLKEFPTRPIKQIHYTNVVKALASQVKSGSSTVLFGF